MQKYFKVCPNIHSQRYEEALKTIQLEKWNKHRQIKAQVTKWKAKFKLKEKITKESLLNLS